MIGDQLAAWYTAEQIAYWQENGLGDFEADEVCIALGVFPENVFQGYVSAGLDCHIYP